MGVATMVTQEALTELCEPFMPVIPPAPVPSAPETILVAEGPSIDYVMENHHRYPNLISVESVPPNRQVAIPGNTKLTPSYLHNRLAVPPAKQPSIMSRSDPRSEGRDPITVSLEKLCTAPQPDVAPDPEVYQDMLNYYRKTLVWPLGKRELTFEEACGGVPGKLNSITTQTSPGYPLIFRKTKKGKRDFVWHDDAGELCYLPAFKEMVLRRVKVMETFDGEDIDHCFLGYMKDELRSLSKILKCATRMTYANSMISIVAFRMKFGAILSAFNHSGHCSENAIGLNQYSHDMQVIYDGLTEIGPPSLIAGDFSDYDINMLDVSQQESYALLGELSCEWIAVGDHSWRYLVCHETQSPAQVGNLLLYLRSNNFSGCFFTSIVNGLVQSNYWRRSFKRRFPNEFFDLCCRLKLLGDDHLLNIVMRLEWTPLDVREDMKELGQIYTSCWKDRPLEDHRIGFDEVLFLGAHPRMVLGSWSGALRKETLWETVQWTRDSNLTFHQIVQQQIELGQTGKH